MSSRCDAISARVLCIFPFEEAYFARHGVPATYIGHPLTRTARPTMTKQEFCRKHGIDESKPLVALLPGSRIGEVARHLPALRRRRGAHPDADRGHPDPGDTLTVPREAPDRSFFRERIGGSSIQVIEGETSDTLAHADVAIAASGTVTVEGAILGTPMVTFYKVTPLSWTLGRFLVRVPFYSMVNLVAGRRIVPELMQDEATGENWPPKLIRLLEDAGSRNEMKDALAGVSSKLASSEHPMERAARIVNEYLKRPVEVNLRSMYMGRFVKPIGGLAALVAALSPAQAQQDRRVRVDVQNYVIDAEINPRSADHRGHGTGAIHPAGSHLFGSLRSE